MAITVLPYIPFRITVHLGPPDTAAENVTVLFQDYIKNVASSEIYPTWQPAALRANILAQVSFALNRVYTEFYPSQGYSFNITNTTAYDQRYIHGRNTFENVDVLVDALFTTYIRRPGFAEPLAAHFCNGTTSICDGLSQWGSEELAQQGFNSMEILRRYYGSQLELVNSARIQEIRYSYPDTALRLGDQGEEVYVAQIMLGFIAGSYPAIPILSAADGIFGESTRQAVLEFQRVFHLSPDGIIGRSTWYRMVSLYTGLLRLSEISSLGQKSFRLEYQAKDAISFGQQGENVALLQYLLAVLSQFYLSIPNLAIDGVYGEETQDAVRALQQDVGMPQTGVVDQSVWNQLVERFISIDRSVLSQREFFSFQGSGGEYSPEELQDILIGRQGQFPGSPLMLGQRDG